MSRFPALLAAITFTTLSSALCLAGPGMAGRAGMGARGGGAAASQPAPRNDANSQLAHNQLLDKAKQGKGKIDIYFEGDSIMRRWALSDTAYAKYLANWKENFFGWNAADFGWGADRVENILWRLQNGELDDVNPKIIVLLAGTNNLNAAQGDNNVSDITKGIQAVIETCQKKSPDSVIILTGIFPRNDQMADIPIINKINDNLAKLADGKKIRYLNINEKLADKDGKLLAGMMNTDKLHPDTKGYQVYADALKPIFTELLGPPAKEDHAPPPTGDPSAAPKPAASAPARGATP